MTAALAMLALVGGLFPTVAVAADPDPAAGYDVTWLVTGADAEPRTDGKIAVGDDLQLTYTAVDETPVTACQIRITTTGGHTMITGGDVTDGACRLAFRLPEPPDQQARAALDPYAPALDLCVVPDLMTFADSQARASLAEDAMAPGGRDCDDRPVYDPALAALDFPIEPGGARRPFASEPAMVSWDPADWGAGVGTIQFGETWHFELPGGFAWCEFEIITSGHLSIRPRVPDGCASSWDVRIPGVLPASLTADVDDPWTYYIGVAYDRTEPSFWRSLTVAAGRTSVKSSDTVFESSLPALFPTDLATTRFVTAGERWRPAFQLGGTNEGACRMERHGPGETYTRYTAPADETGRCEFDIDPLSLGEFHQYWVWPGTWDDDITTPTFAGSITAIAPPEPPTIEPPLAEGDGDTGIGVEPGDGQGLALTLEVAPDPLTSDVASDVASESPVCTDQSVSTDVDVGGLIPHLDASCGLAPGRYIATATMVDAAGVAVSDERLFTVVTAPPHVVGRQPPSGAIGVARDVRPTLTFDVPVTGVSGTSVRLRDLVTGSFVTATVTYDPGTRKATIKPGGLLRAGRSYRVIASSAIKNADGIGLPSTHWSFTVTKDATKPTIIGRLPSRNATGVKRTSSVAVRFSSSVKGVSGSSFQLRDLSTGQYVPAAVSYDGSRHRAVLNPSVTLSANHRYLVIVRSSIADKAGNPFSTTTWAFKTAS